MEELKGFDCDRKGEGVGNGGGNRVAASKDGGGGRGRENAGGLAIEDGCHYGLDLGCNRDRD